MRQVKHPEVNWFDWNAYHADCFVAYARMSLLSMKEAVTRTLFDFLKDVDQDMNSIRNAIRVWLRWSIQSRRLA